MTSRTLWPSLVTKGKSPPSGPACPMDGLLHTYNYRGRYYFLISSYQPLAPGLINNNENFKVIL
jgi:hypothetical protein